MNSSVQHNKAYMQHNTPEDFAKASQGCHQCTKEDIRSAPIAKIPGDYAVGQRCQLFVV